MAVWREDAEQCALQAARMNVSMSVVVLVPVVLVRALRVMAMVVGDLGVHRRAADRVLGFDGARRVTGGFATCSPW